MIFNLENDSHQNEYTIAAFYSFSFLAQELIDSLLEEVNVVASQYDIRGMVLFANEGINGTICGTPKGVSIFFTKIKSAMSGKICEIKYSSCIKQAFRRFRARRKKEIVTMGVREIDPNEQSGRYVEPSEWNALLDDPETLVIDTRNKYEIAVGTFEGSLNPLTDTFRDFPEWVDQTLRPLVGKDRPKQITMFCTGGIRCEKATSYLRKEGFDEVSHLHGGILKYLEAVPKEESKWEGECFVFDRRVALNHDLLPGLHLLCNACGMPLSPRDREKPCYIRGVKCHYCEDHFTDEDRHRFAERQRYIDQMSKSPLTNTLWPNP
tara:strand:+ start:8682 stop:9647 length:966 start_codon:yes stop_codon:yes gene_type:complete